MAENSAAKSYDLIAEAYAERFFTELEGKALDRALLDVFAISVRGRGQAADVGCGPGHVALWLHQHGVPCVGIDVSEQTIAVARRLSPELAFEPGSMLALRHPDRSFAGVTAFYAIVNLTHEEVKLALGELFRVLAPEGLLLLSFHLGDERLHVEELLGSAVALDFYLFPRSFMEMALRQAGFEIEAWLERRPYPTEHPTTRGYVLARRP